MANIRMLSARRELVEKEKLKDQGTVKARRNQESDTQDVSKKTNTSESERTAKKAKTDASLAESEEKIAKNKKQTAIIGATIGAVGAIVGFAATVGKAISNSKPDDKPKPDPKDKNGSGSGNDKASKPSFLDKVLSAVGLGKKEEKSSENSAKTEKSSNNSEKKAEKSNGTSGKKQETTGSANQQKPISSNPKDNKTVEIQPVAEKQSLLDKILSAVGLGKKEDKAEEPSEADAKEEKGGFLKNIVGGGDDDKSVKAPKAEKTDEQKQKFKDDQATYTQLFKSLLALGSNNSIESKSDVKIDPDKKSKFERIEQNVGDFQAAIQDAKNGKSGDPNGAFGKRIEARLQASVERDNSKIVATRDSSKNEVKNLEAQQKTNTSDSALLARVSPQPGAATNTNNPNIPGASTTKTENNPNIPGASTTKTENNPNIPGAATNTNPSGNVTTPNANNAIESSGVTIPTTTQPDAVPAPAGQPFNPTEVARLKELGAMNADGTINQAGLTEATTKNKTDGAEINTSLTSANERFSSSTEILNSIKKEMRDNGNLDGSKGKAGGLNSKFLQSLASIIGLDLKDIKGMIKSPEKVEEKKVKDAIDRINKDEDPKNDIKEDKQAELLQAIKDGPEKFAKNQDIKRLAEKYKIDPAQMAKYFETDDKGNVSLKKGEGQGILGSIKNTFASESNIAADIRSGNFIKDSNGQPDKVKTAEFLKELDSSIQGGLSGNILNDVGGDLAKNILNATSSEIPDNIKALTSADGKSIDIGKLNKLKVENPEKYNQALETLGLTPESDITPEALNNGLNNLSDSKRVINNPTFMNMLQSAGLGKDQSQKMVRDSGRDRNNAMENEVGGAKGQGQGQRGNWFNMMVLGLNASMPAIQFMLQQLDKMREAEDQLNEARAKKAAANALLAKLGADLKRTQGAINGDAKDLPAEGK